MKTKVHRIVLLVVDHDDLGPAEAKHVLENARYPNHCMRPEVLAIETREVAWTDDHPLNFKATTARAVSELFDEPT